MRVGKQLANYYGDNSMYHRYEALVRHLRKAGLIPNKAKVMSMFPNMVEPAPIPGIYIYMYLFIYMFYIYELLCLCGRYLQFYV